MEFDKIVSLTCVSLKELRKLFMEAYMEIKVGDLVKLRDDLEDDKGYGGHNTIFREDMGFEGFKKVTCIGNINFKVEDKHSIYSGLDYWYAKEMAEEVKRPCQYKTIYKKQEILDKEEKEYLRAVIKPFRDSVRCINKILIGDSDEYIEIEMNKNDDILLPYFRRGTMYKGMERDKDYTLEELGL